MCAALSLPIHAASLQVSPVSLAIAADQSGAALWLINSGDAVINAQVRAYRWSQRQGQDRYAETSAILVSPPFTRIEPGSRQMVRVLRSDSVRGDRSDQEARPAEQEHTAERAFRLIVDELPIQDERKGIQFVIRYSVPVFMRPPSNDRPTPQLDWRLLTSGGSAELAVTNSGPGHAQLADVKLLDTTTGKAFSINDGLLGYVLPGATMRWRVQPLRSSSSGPYLAEALLNGVPTQDIRVSGE